MCRWHHPYGRKWRGTQKPLDESERGEWKTWLKTQHSKNKHHGIQSHHFMAKMGKKWKQWHILFSWLPKSLQTVTAAMKLKDSCSLNRKLWKQRVYSKTKISGEQDGRVVGGRGVHLSLWIHSDTKVLAEHHLRVARSTWSWGKNIQNHTKFGRAKELGGKTGVFVGLNLPLVASGTEAEVWSPYWGKFLSQRRNI